MDLLDIIGPVMIGPSSSHTAGAVRIGNVARKLLGERVVQADVYFHGSFLATGKGHGTDRAIIAGLLGFAVDDERIPNSFDAAKEQGLVFQISGLNLGDVHPNTVKLILSGETGKTKEIVACSVGGGRIEITQIDNLSARFSGESPTLIIQNRDRPGLVREVASLLEETEINIATMQLHRDSRGGNAVMVIECDREIGEAAIQRLEHEEGILRVTYLSTSNP